MPALREPADAASVAGGIALPPLRFRVAVAAALSGLRPAGICAASASAHSAASKALRARFPNVPVLRIDRDTHAQRAHDGVAPRNDRTRRTRGAGRHADAREGTPLPARHARRRVERRRRIHQSGLPRTRTHGAADRSGGGTRRTRRTSRRSVDSDVQSGQSIAAGARRARLRGLRDDRTRATRGGRASAVSRDGAIEGRRRRRGTNARVPAIARRWLVALGSRNPRTDAGAARATRASLSLPDRTARARPRHLGAALDQLVAAHGQSRYPGVRWSIDVDPYDMF